jgi:hypothetical protein
MSTYRLRPWTEIVRLHPDVEAGNTAVATYAIDLGALAAGDQNIPVCYRDAESFFRVTYPTSGLRRMLEDVLSRLAGKDGDRVLQLRSPFGGGKSHTLAALYHAAKNRAALAQIPDLTDLPDPGRVRVAVFDGEKFDALVGREISGPACAAGAAGRQRIRTIWGLLAWQLGEDAFARVREHDERRVAPGGDVISDLLGDQPTLLLLDEVLKYLERASGERIADSTLERQTKDFLQSLSVEVARMPRAVMVYSLQASAREAMGNIGLLQEIDHLTSRVDAKREPVTGDEILPVLQRRLLSAPPDGAAASAAAQALSEVVTRMRAAHADSEQARRLAEEEGLRLRQRMEAAYPFHPALVDVMKERWASIPDFQRTRGALRFLAVCMHVLRSRGGAQAVFGPGDVPIYESDVRYAFFTEVGQREPFQPVLEADLVGPNARVKHIDDRLAKENPALAHVKPAMRLATAILMYSFGGLPKEGTEGGETLPPGVTEAELLAACVGPDLDNITAQACLKEMREVRGCLYLHFDGARYCFKTTPNVNMLIEQEADSVKPQEIRSAIKERLEKRLSGQRAAFVWPEQSDQIPDEEPCFQIAYLPIEFAQQRASEQDRVAKELFEKYGDRPRRYRNGLGLAIPAKAQLEPLRRAVRYLLAIERVESKKKQLGVTKEQAEQLRERQRTEEAAEESAFRQLYAAVWLPKLEGGAVGIEPVEIGGRPLQSAEIHARIMELLTVVSPPRLFGTLAPRRIIELLRLGESPEAGQPARLGIKSRDVQDAFFGILGFPRLTEQGVLRRAIVRGVGEGVFAYYGQGEPSLGTDGRYQVSLDRIAFQREVGEDEVDMADGFLIMPSAIPAKPEVPGPTPPGPEPPPGPVPPVTPPGPGPTPAQTDVRLGFRADRQQLYAAWGAVANLADKAGSVHVQVDARSEEGFDPQWLRNAVKEPLEEADVELDPPS